MGDLTLNLGFAKSQITSLRGGLQQVRSDNNVVREDSIQHRKAMRELQQRCDELQADVDSARREKPRDRGNDWYLVKG